MQENTNDIEKELLSRVAEGNEQAFKDLLKQIVPVVEAIVFRITHSDDAVREILQETFVRIWINRDKLPGLEKPLPWFKRVALNETFTWLNRNAARAKIFSALYEEQVASTENPTDRLSLRETMNLLQHAIDLLPEQRKRIYILSREEGMRPVEIARRLNISEGYVKNALTSALQSLRTQLKKAGRTFLIF